MSCNLSSILNSFWVCLFEMKLPGGRAALGRRAARPADQSDCRGALEQALLGGVDSKGSHVFSVDPAGGCIEDRFVSVGSGSTILYGLLEEGFSRDMATSDGVDLALRGLTAAMKRDSASGDGYLVHIITPKEYRELSEDEINKRLKALKIPLPPVLP